MSCNVARFLPHSASIRPGDVALRIPQGWEEESIRYRSLSFAQLESLSNRCAHALRRKGVDRGMRVQLAVRPGLDLILITFALFKLGAIPVVIDPGMGRKQFLACVNRSRPDVLVGIPRAIRLSRLFFWSFRRLKTRIPVGPEFEKQLLDPMPDTPLLIPADSDDLAAILFTSGSTGAPKGVLYEHGMFDAQVRLIGNTYGIRSGEVDLPLLPVFALFNPALGMATVVPEMDPSRPATVEPRNIVQAILQNEVTNSFGSPVLWKKICHYCLQHSIQLPSIKRVLMAGAPVPPVLVEAFSRVIVNGEIFTPYGATEAMPVSSISGSRILRQRLEQCPQAAGTCVGLPIQELEVRIIRIEEAGIKDLKDTELLPPGQVGEIIVKGPVVTKGYDQLAEATGLAKIYEGEAVWHRMGDAGYRDEAGNLWFCGRVAERVQTREGPVFTEPVEAYFNGQAGVFRSALIGLGLPPHQIPAIVIEPEAAHWPPDPAAETAWARRLLENIPPHSAAASITRVFFHKAFPVDVRHNAKIHRLTLARQFDK